MIQDSLRKAKSMRRAIKRKLKKDHPEKYPDYVKRYGNDMLKLVNELIDIIHNQQQIIENLSYLDRFIKAEILLEANR